MRAYCACKRKSAKNTVPFFIRFSRQIAYRCSERKQISAIVDYNDILYSPTLNKVEVRIGEMPMIYKNVSLNMDSVEYIIEKLDQ